MILHTCMVSYNRLDCLQRSITSYMETISIPFTFVVVDNGSSKPTRDWLRGQEGIHVLRLGRNRYPGFACNRGWEFAPAKATHLHRADNDFIYREGWCDEVAERFETPDLGQLGLLTDIEENFAPSNVGGNCVIRRELWDEGLRYNELPWPELPQGWSEDSYMTPDVVKMGWEWGRVQRSCIMGISTPNPRDPYYTRTYRDRNILGILKSVK